MKIYNLLIKFINNIKLCNIVYIIEKEKKPKLKKQGFSLILQGDFELFLSFIFDFLTKSPKEYFDFLIQIV